MNRLKNVLEYKQCTVITKYKKNELLKQHQRHVIVWMFKCILREDNVFLENEKKGKITKKYLKNYF